jgi:hypothetical protein
MTRRSGTGAVVLAMAVVLSSTVRADVSVSTGAIRATVADSTGAVLPQAHLVLQNESLGFERQADTASDGTFIFSLLPPASGYQLEIRAANFKSATITNLVVRVTEVTNASLRMSIGIQTETITVSADDQQIEVTHPALGGTLTAGALTALPLLTRNIVQLLATDPGVISDPGSTTLFVAGSRSTFNNYMLNGVDANNFRTNALTNNLPTPSPDAVEEFRTQTSLYDASVGRNSGAAISVITRSGTDHFHGNLYEFFRSSHLAANDFFLNRSGAARPFFLRNQFGASLGGPIPVGDRKTFVFMNYEGSRQRNATTISGLLPVLPASRSASGLAAAFGLPTTAIDPVAVNILNLPGPFGGRLVPSGAGASPGRLGSFNFAATSNLNQDQGTIRGDRAFRLFGGDNHLSLHAFGARTDLATPISDPSLFFGQVRIGNGSIDNFANRVYGMDDIHVINPHMLNQLA